ncbi:MAG: aminotransferase class V-fold PLP-dependent enzyme [Gemmatimonadales bacterium]|nr:aminotransferase class V-fold PLP-dependent enzyme [Gemmatimonadales bacterium]
MGDRREFLQAAGVTLIGTVVLRGGRHSAQAPTGWAGRFPPTTIAYLDSAATTRRPTEVIDAISHFYRTDNANPTPLHELGRRAAAAYDDARRTVAAFIGAKDPLEVVFTRGTTEAINLAAAAWGSANLQAGDEILLSVAEHASNMVPWQMIARRTGARIGYFDLNDDGSLKLSDFEARLSRRTKLVAVSHVSNALGMVNPVAEICGRARAIGAVTMVDAAQSIPHMPVDVQALGCDLLAFSSHKMAGPMGAGVLWARAELLERMPPYQGGSNMAHAVGLHDMELSAGALKFGAGTPNVADAVGMAAAVRFLGSLGWSAMEAHGREITAHLLNRLGEVPGLRIVGSARPEGRIPLAAFNLAGHQPADVAKACDREGIAVRAGDMAALPLLKRFGIESAVRASCYLYTTTAEIDRLAVALKRTAQGH